MAVEPDPTTTKPPPDVVSADGSRTNRQSSRWAVIGIVVCFLLGINALLAALLLPLAIYPRVAVLPEDPAQRITTTTHGATLLVPDRAAPAGLREMKNAEVTSTTTVSKAPGQHPDGNVVWQISTTSTVRGIGPFGRPTVERVSIDRRTGSTTNCCDDRIGSSPTGSDSVPVRHEGQMTWPFNVQQHAYPLWDGTLQRARTTAFMKEEKRDGLSTYVFRSEVPRQKIGTRELPGALFGRSEPVVKADSWYANTKTFWIEPVTGTPVSERQVQVQEYTFGGRTVTAFAATVETEKLSDSRLHKVGMGARWLPWIQGRAAYVLGPLGALLVVAGVVAVRRRAAARPGIQ
jgi:hypothetical protein